MAMKLQVAQHVGSLFYFSSNSRNMDLRKWVTIAKYFIAFCKTHHTYLLSETKLPQGIAQLVLEKKKAIKQNMKSVIKA